MRHPLNIEQVNVIIYFHLLRQERTTRKRTTNHTIDVFHLLDLKVKLLALYVRGAARRCATESARTFFPCLLAFSSVSRFSQVIARCEV